MATPNPLLNQQQPYFRYGFSSPAPKKEKEEILCITAPHLMMLARPGSMLSISLESYGAGVRLAFTIYTETTKKPIKQTLVEWKGMDIRDLPKNAIKIFEEDFNRKTDNKSIFNLTMDLCPVVSCLEEQTEKNKQLRLQKEKEMESSGVKDTTTTATTNTKGNK